MSKNTPVLTISVASSLLKLHPRTLMLYEKAELVTPHRTNTKRRLYSAKDLERLQFIKFLTRKKGINLQGVRFLLEAIDITREKNIRLRRSLFPSFKPRSLV